MVYLPQDAEDATQEILVKLITKLSTFEGRSSFRTWLYRIVVNHVLNIKREPTGRWTFTRYGEAWMRTPDMELPDPTSVPADVQLLVDEARIGCTSGMLLCLDREQRLIYILGGIFGVPDLRRRRAPGDHAARTSGRSSRGRAAISTASCTDKCGLVNTPTPAVARRRPRDSLGPASWIRSNLLFAREHVTRVREVAPIAVRGISRRSTRPTRSSTGIIRFKSRRRS